MTKINRDFRRKIDLLWLLTKKEVVLKYKRTFLGVLWSLLNPTLLAIVFFIAFKIFLRIQIENFPFFVLTALFPWNWFSTSVILSTGVLISNVTLIKKGLFPRHFLILSTVLSQLINFVFALPIIIGLSFFYGKGPGINWFLVVPILILLQFMVTTGISLLISIVNAYFRDMDHIIGIFLSMLFWFTPIVYPFDMVPKEYQAFLLLNPLTYLITAWRDIFMLNLTNWSNIGLSFCSCVIFFIVGIIVFRKLGKRLDEVL